MESHWRSIVKAISWRICATMVTFVLAWKLGADLSLALKIGAGDLVSKLILYYFHERAWMAIPFGRPKGLEFEI